MGFLSGLAGLGKNVMGRIAGGGMAPGGGAGAEAPMAPMAPAPSPFQSHMGGLAHGLSSLSSNLFDQPPAAPAMQARRKLPFGPQPAVAQPQAPNTSGAYGTDPNMGLIA